MMKPATNAIQEEIIKTKMCNFHLAGRCSKGRECTFAHSPHELRPQVNLFKTRPCAAFVRKGACNEGKNCRFAHGVTELRMPRPLSKANTADNLQPAFALADAEAMQQVQANAGDLGCSSKVHLDLNTLFGNGAGSIEASVDPRLQAAPGAVSMSTIAQVPRTLSSSDCSTIAPPSLSGPAHSEFGAVPPPPGLAGSWSGAWCGTDGAFFEWSAGTQGVAWQSSAKPLPTKSASHDAGDFDQMDAFARIVDDIVGCDADEDELHTTDSGSRWSIERSLSASSDAVGKDDDTIAKQLTTSDSFVAPLLDIAFAAMPSEELLAIPPMYEEYLCTKSWKEFQSNDACLSVVQGQRLFVMWMDPRPNSWVYGSFVDDPFNQGYCPKDIITKAPPLLEPPALETPIRVHASFEAPKFCDGYLTVNAGEVVIVLCQVQRPYIWAYVECISKRPACECGWIPVSVLESSV
eukprot:TRINITY_DN15589_c0_g1_i1.p1 TRINITY_DN15589_c0_g1~~TRINITY_DN15589_c0_g1_i1.p1  ORF type:complete len:463 (+),score=56.99 TRINITY_DN15589_c0_g1_i1:31-1419(+)